jgi:hypothetical protein
MRALALFGALLALVGSSVATAQDTEPRRWTHLPTGTNIIGVGFGGAAGDIFLDPVLEIEDAEFERWNLGLSYIRTFGLLGRSARIDVQAPYVMGRWEGQLSGAPASTRRHGFADPRIRLSWLLYGGEALAPEAWAATPRSDTVVGAGLSVAVPLGEYYPERLINLGTNRWTIRPQLGVTHTRGPWTGELTGSVFLFTDNDDLNGQRQENDPLWAIQGHLIYNFRPGVWASLSSAYGDGSDVTVDGVPREVRTENWLVSLAFGVPVNRRQSLKFAWVRARTQRFDGTDSDNLVVAWSWLLP